ncbi:hypothetical protein E3J59_03720 [Candidatus Aerophobetes bacterium]|uniref:Uncharacterized protein n=1 Tax=Aerophobetes bacterium TaxID=2030807 RepID=A0A523USF4_UNCAE|nr:MAG: hypothetical protein E3J59_03720 [Candidatus Aerophobetes bacterium]
MSDVKRILSEDEFVEEKDKIERAKQSLEEIRSALSSALFLHNGKLSTGTIDYAAFRIETISLIFEVASRNFRRSAKSGPKAYDDFLADLGEEVGFTFARNLISRVKSRNLFLEVQDVKKLIQLWTLFENETGAGETKLKSYSDEKIVIQLRNNPLRWIESARHTHCGFYRNYIRSFLNELHTLRARLLEQEITGIIGAQARKVVDVLEKPDAEDNCVFVAQLRSEILTRSFNALYKAYEQFDKFSEADDFSPCASQARSALVLAQMDTIGLKGKSPRQFFKVFQEVLTRDDFRRMDEVYQVISKYVHPETSQRLTKSRCWEILRDIRRSVYAFEFLDLTEEQRVEFRNKAILNDLVVLTGLVQKTEKLALQERNETVQLLSRLKKGELTEERHQVWLVECLKRLGGRVWEVAKPILAELISATIRKQYGL